MAGRGKGPLRIAIEDFIETYVSGTFEKWFGVSIKKAEDAIHEVTNEGVAIIETTIEPDDLLGQQLHSVLSAEHQGGVAALAGFGAQMGMGAASGLMAPYMRTINYAIDIKKRSARADPGAAIPMIWRSPEFGELLAKGMRELGWRDELIVAWTALIAPVVPAPTLITLFMREMIGESELRDELHKQGWEDERIDKLILEREVIPGVSDLISMAVREAFTPETIEKFQYAQDFPDEILEFTNKQGLPEHWVWKYWYAHWILPSTQAGYEMMHRLRPGTTDNPFTSDDMRTLLKTADIAPFFRERLMEISYRPYTRVDVRRMYKAHVLSADEVYQSYLDIGYDETKAQKLADFAILDAGSEDRDLSRSLIERAYRRKTIDRSEALTALRDIGYPSDNAEFILILADADMATGFIDDQVESTHFLYVEGEITEPDVYSQLGHLNLPSEQIALMIGKWDIERRKKRALPSKGDLENWYEKGLIEIDALQEGLTKRRYITKDVDLYVLQLDQEIADRATREAERAQKEQERLEAAELKSVFQVEKAGVDVLIAQAALAIADLKLAQHDMIDAVQIDAAKKEIAQLKSYIAEQRLSKSEIKLVEAL